MNPLRFGVSGFFKFFVFFEILEILEKLNPIFYFPRISKKCNYPTIFKTIEQMNPLRFGVSGFFKSFNFFEILEILKDKSDFFIFREFQNF